MLMGVSISIVRAKTKCTNEEAGKSMRALGTVITVTSISNELGTE
jgi:hypothetical protein